MGVRNIKKQLAGVEDLLLGEGTEQQERASGIRTITKLNKNKVKGLYFDTIETAQAIDYFVNGDTLVITEEGRGGTFKFNASGLASDDNGGTIFTVTTGGTLERIYDGAVNVEWFGAKSKTGFDNKTYIESALNVGKQVFFPKGTYEVSSTISTEVLDIIGDFAQDSSRIMYTGISGALFEVTGYYSTGVFNSVKQIKLYGIDKTYDTTALFFKNDLAEDVDAFVSKCNIQYFSKAIHIKGRGLFVDDSLFYAVQSCIYFDRNDPVIEGTNTDQKISTGWRAFSITNCRFHGLGGAIILDNTNINNSNRDTLRGVLFENNYIDTTATIAKGQFSETKISNNIVIYGGSNIVLFSLTGSESWDNVSITGNTFTSKQGLEYKNILYFDDGTTSNGLNISNNTINKVKEEVFKFGNLSHSIISNNTMSDVCLSANTSYQIPIKIVGYSNKNTMTGNTIDFSAIDANNLDYAFKFFGSFDYTIVKDNVMNYSIIEESNKTNGVRSSVLTKKLVKGASDVTRNNTGSSEQVFIDTQFVSKSPSSTVFIEANIQFEGGSINSLTAIRIRINGTTLLNLQYLWISAGENRSNSYMFEATMNDISRIEMLVADGTSNDVDFTVKADSYISITEVES